MKISADKLSLKNTLSYLSVFYNTNIIQYREKHNVFSYKSIYFIRYSVIVPCLIYQLIFD